MINFLEAIVGFIANLLSIVFSFLEINKPTLNFKNKKIRTICSITVTLLFLFAFIMSFHYLSGHPLITVTQVLLDESSLIMNTGDTKFLKSTVLYSDNSSDSNTIWHSNNPSIISVESNGQITALSEGTAVIIAQASKNNTTESAMCVITVKNPPKGYSISARPSGINSYYYIYIKPYDDDITQIKLYAKSPSGEIFNPPIDENNLYHFYSECGTWTIYASLESDGGAYEANKPDDFLTLEITDIATTQLETFLPNLTLP